MSAQPFTHLHLHTEYSLLDGANKIKVLAKSLKGLGMTSVAMTDHGNMFGAIDFYQTMKKEGIKPIIGLEAYIHNNEVLEDKSTRQRFHLCLFAKNIKGYENLMYLSSQSYLNGFYYYPRLNKELLKEHSEGLIATSACLQGEVNWNLNLANERNVKAGARGIDGAIEAALEYKEIFGDDFYLEIMRHGIGDQQYIDTHILEVARKTDIKIIATNDTHYLKQDDAEAHEAFMCIAMNKQLDDPNRLKHSVKEFYLKTPEQMATLYADIPEALSNTQEIVEKCNVELDLGNPTPPLFKFSKFFAKQEELALTSDDEFNLQNDIDLFIHVCKKGLENRLRHIPKQEHPTYWERLDFEMDIINSMKFPGYMLVVWDFVRVAKEMDIPVGPGRGSAAGSLVAYALDITDINPIPYDLLFERFLNPERVSMPDIDMDFCQARRGEIIDYVVEKYGRNNVAQIITFGSLLAKGVLRDVSRVLGVPYAEADKFAKLIPDELGINLEKAFEKEPKIEEKINENPQANRVWEFGKALEGLKRNAGMHAAGVVISNEALWYKTPLYKPSGETTLVTQYSLNFLEDVDLIKFDFLGLKTLDVIDNALKLIKSHTGKVINFSTLPMDDQAVFDLICSGDTLGLFQIESQGMQQLNAKLRPSTFEDIIAVLALYRPGPMDAGMLDDFIDRKHGIEEIHYFYDEFEIPLKPILEPTYGVIVYQEQVMQIVQTLGGFSLGKADIVRRAMGKKKLEEMIKYKAEFAEGAKEQGYTYDNAAELFELIIKFAGYGFNKSHSAAYAMITYQTAYLKCHYPAEFMSALLTSEAGNTDKIVRYIDEVKRLNIAFKAPDINRSHINFVPFYDEKGVPTVMFGMGAIKGVGNAALSSLIHERQDSGMFANLSDFISRIDPSKVNKKVVESMIKSGGFDDFNLTRSSMLAQLEEIVDSAKKATQLKKDAQFSLFGDSAEMTEVTINIPTLPEFNNKEILDLEKETMGIYVSGHPLDDYREKLDSVNHTLSSEIEELGDGSEALFIGKVEEIVSKISKKGNKFGIINLMDLHGNIEFMVFEKMLNQLEEIDLEEPIAFKVSVNKDDQFTRIVARKIIALKDVGKEKIKQRIIEKSYEPITIAVPMANEQIILHELRQLVEKYSGNHPLHIIIKSKLQDVQIQTGVMVGKEIIAEIAKNQQFQIVM
jgi:DNA polymerase III subunit alpha